VLRNILNATQTNKWSTDNIAFGSGGGLLQKVDRDTLKFAFKCSSITVDGKIQDVWKDPISDKGKQSKRGRLKLLRKYGSHGITYETVPESYDGLGELQLVFANGNIMQTESFEDIRQRANRKRVGE